jgi:hypothetical protein
MLGLNNFISFSLRVFWVERQKQKRTEGKYAAMPQTEKSLLAT